MTWQLNGAQRIPEGDIFDRFAAEEPVAQAVAERAGLRVFALDGRYSVVDRALVDDTGIRAWLEVKTRTTPRLAYPTYRIAADKMDGLRNLGILTDTNVNLAVEWSCGSIGIASVFRPEWRVEGDSEHLPIEKFAPVRLPREVTS